MPATSRVVGRAAVVLVASHFERYIRALNEEALSSSIALGAHGNDIPVQLRLLHSQASIDAIAEMQWDNRDGHLAEFVKTESWLWSNAPAADFDHNVVLRWMKAPTPARLIRYFAYWGIDDIFDRITRNDHTRTELRLKLGELVDKRNNIAHGDLSLEATSTEVRGYLLASRKFCDRVDRQLGNVLRKKFGQHPW